MDGLIKILICLKINLQVVRSPFNQFTNISDALVRRSLLMYTFCEENTVMSRNSGHRRRSKIHAYGNVVTP